MADEIQKRRARLIQLMSEENLTQTKLGRRCGIAQQNISRMRKDIEAPDFLKLSESNAQAIVSEFPKYRIQWLLGYDDFKTEADLLAHYFDKQKKQDNEERALFILLSSMGKWTVDPSSVIGGAEYDPDNEAMNDVNFFSWEFENYARISKGKTAISLNKNEFERLVSKTADYFNFELAHMS